MRVEKRPCTTAVADLVSYLKGTGTGTVKLDTLTQLGQECECLDHVLEQAAQSLPALTMEKVDSFLLRCYPGAMKPKGQLNWINTKRYQMLKNAQEEDEKEAALAASEDEDMEETVQTTSLPATTTTSGGEDGAEDEASEVVNDNAKEAIDKISRMLSTDKLEHIVMTDTRKTVQEAAQKRLDELKPE